MFNRVVLVGKIISDLNKSESNGVVYVDFILEVRHRYGKRVDNKPTPVEVVTVKVLTWGYNAQLCYDLLSKGSYVLVEGGLKFDSEDREYYIGAWNVVFLDKACGNLENVVVGSQGNNKEKADNTSKS